MFQRIKWALLVLLIVLAGWFISIMWTSKEKISSGHSTSAPTVKQETKREPKAEIGLDKQPAPDPPPSSTVMTPKQPRSPMQAMKTEKLHRRWLTDQENPKWTSDTTSYLQKQMSTHGVAGVIQDIDCKRTVCRVVISFKKPEQASRLRQIPIPEGYKRVYDVSQNNGSIVITLWILPPGVVLDDILEN